MQNDYNRVLLYSGEDGFDFFDDFNKRTNQTCRLLLIENKSEMDIKNIKISTESVLRNMNTDEQITYKTQNVASLLRGKESIVLRLANQEQFEKIIAMNNASIPSLFRFECIIEYLTLAEQKIRYVYRININNDRRIEIECDGIEDIQDNVQYKTENPTIFRNLQDYISSIDRSSYAWEKMGQAQMKGILAQYNPQGNRTENKEKEE